MKDNQPRLKEDIAIVWEDEPGVPPHAVQTNKHGGRVEQRQLWASDTLVGYSDWPHRAQVCWMVRRVTRRGDTKLKPK